MKKLQYFIFAVIAVILIIAMMAIVNVGRFGFTGGHQEETECSIIQEKAA